MYNKLKYSHWHYVQEFLATLKTVGDLLLLFFLWSGCCLFDTFPISILNFRYKATTNNYIWSNLIQSNILRMDGLSLQESGGWNSLSSRLDSLSWNRSSFIILVPNGKNILEYYFLWNKYYSQCTVNVPNRINGLEYLIQQEQVLQHCL